LDHAAAHRPRDPLDPRALPRAARLGARRPGAAHGRLPLLVRLRRLHSPLRPVPPARQRAGGRPLARRARAPPRAAEPAADRVRRGVERRRGLGPAERRLRLAPRGAHPRDHRRPRLPALRPPRRARPPGRAAGGLRGAARRGQPRPSAEGRRRVRGPCPRAADGARARPGRLRPRRGRPRRGARAAVPEPSGGRAVRPGGDRARLPGGGCLPVPDGCGRGAADDPGVAPVRHAGGRVRRRLRRGSRARRRDRLRRAKPRSRRPRGGAPRAAAASGARPSPRGLPRRAGPPHAGPRRRGARPAVPVALMRVGFVIGGIPSLGYSGSTLASWTIVETLLRAGHEVTAVLCPAGYLLDETVPGRLEELERLGADVRIVEVAERSFLLHADRRTAALLRRFASVGVFSGHHAEWARRHGVNAWYAHYPMPDLAGPTWRERRAAAQEGVERPRILMIGHLRGIGTISGLHLFVPEILPLLTEELGPDGFEVH